MLSIATVTLLTLSTTLAHPYYPGFPRFHSENGPLDQPTVNVFKIYAPRLFYMPEYKSLNGKGAAFKKDKQMISSDEHAIEHMFQNEMFPDSVFDDGANSIFDYDDDYVPEPSNIVSRKLPVYVPLPGPPMMAGPFEPSMLFNEFPPMMGNDPHDYMDDVPDYYDMHDENCEHHGVFQTFNPIMNEDYPDYPTVQFMDPFFMNNIPRQGPMGGPAFPIISANPIGPLTTFFKKFVSESTKSNQIPSQVFTTVSFGQPEIFEEERKTITEQIEKLNERDNTAGDGITTVIIAGELPVSSDEENEVSNIVEEIERNLVRTILTDDSVLRQEVNEPMEIDDSRESGEDESLEEVEVNIVKTVLPDETYLISEAGGENEKIQDEVISMIQNGESFTADGSKGSLFISRYLETPDE